MANLDILIQRTYEDSVLGTLPEARYQKLSMEYEREQQEILQLTAILEKEIEEESSQIVDMDRFFVLAEKYANITELTPTLVNELISKIVIHNPEIKYSKKHINIEVFFTYVGKIKIPLQPVHALQKSIEKQV